MTSPCDGALKGKGRVRPSDRPSEQLKTNILQNNFDWKCRQKQIVVSPKMTLFECSKDLGVKCDSKFLVDQN